MNVLIVDDSKSIRKLVGTMLSDCGFHYETAENGQVAVDQLSEGRDYDLILVDWNMPVMDGITFVQKAVSEKLCECPILMMTTENSPDKIRQALEAGAREYLMKPFTAEVLKEKLGQLEG